MSPGIKHRVDGVWVDGGGPTHAKVGGSFAALSAPPAAAPAFVNSAMTVAYGWLYTGKNITIPADTQPGDFMVLVGGAGTSEALEASAGWTLLPGANYFLTSPTRCYVWTRVATAGQAGTNVLVKALSSGAGDTYMVLAMAVYRGSTGAIINTASTNAAVAALTLTAPATVTTVPNSLAIRVWEGQWTLSLPADSRRVVNDRSFTMTLGISDDVIASVGDTGTKDATQSSSGDWAASTIVLAPA